MFHGQNDLLCGLICTWPASISLTELGAVPVAAVELRSRDEPTTAADLTDRAAQGLSRYELPQEIRIVDELPRTPSGKVDLMAVRALFEGEA